jgi:hypothetical protein
MKKIDVWKRKTAKEQRKRAARQEKVSKLLGLRPTMMIIDDPMGNRRTATNERL